MSGRRWGATVLVLLTLIWALFGYYLTKPTDEHDYRTNAVDAAKSAYDALVTARLSAQARLDGRVTRPYLASMLDDARKGLVGAEQDFTRDAPPDSRTTAMREKLGPLLLAANKQLGEVEDAAEDGGPDQLRSAVGALDPLRDQLSTFIETYQ